jgi:hypothetical protein
MSSSTLAHDLQAFAVELFERGGGLADWPAVELPGRVVMPPDVAAAANLPGEEFLLGTTAAPECLHVGLAGEFLDIAANVLEEAVPREGTFSIAERYLTTRDLTDKIVEVFTWQNARATCRSAERTTAEYHLWTLLGSLRSEDVWEAVFRVAVNSQTQGIVELPDVCDDPDLRAVPLLGAPEMPSTYSTAIAEGKRRLIAATADFVHRVEQRLERDRKRLQDYYRALAREADGSKRRAAAPTQTPEEIAAKKRAVDLELRRKMAELEDNYALRATLRPVVLARISLPALIVPVVIERKKAARVYNVYWNSLTKKLEPLSCSACRRPTFSASFTNDSVDLLCTACAEDARSSAR